MNKTKSLKKTLIMSVFSLLLCCSMLLGTTFAWFTDSVSSGSNIIQAGNLDVALEYWDGDEWVDAEGEVIPFVAADGRADILWEPGCTYEMSPFRVRNKGSLNTKILILINGVSGNSKLLEVIDFKTRVENIPDSLLTGSAGNQLSKFEGAELDFFYGAAEGDVVFDWSLAGKGTVTPGTGHTDTSPEFTIFAHMREEAGNEYQGLTIEGISITVIGTQQNYESDSFDKWYDKNATYPAVKTEMVEGGGVVAVSDVTVAIPDGAEKAMYTVEVSNKVKDTSDANETTFSLNINLLKNGKKVEYKAGVSYTVTVDIGEGVIVNGVTHNGEAIENYSYNPSTGIITFQTDSFSPFAISYFDNVISISKAEELITALDAIKTSAKQQIPGTEGNKAYRENAIFVLKEDIVIDSSDSFMYTDSNGAALHFYGVKGILDLNGHSITVSENALLDGKSHANAVLLFQYSNVEIIGEGSIIAQNKSIPVYAWANCTVDIYGGTYVTNASERNESCVYVNNTSATVNVYGGRYTESAYAFNVHDNCGSTTTIILHEGITYADFLKNGTTDVIASDLNSGRIAIADGYSLTEYEENGVAMNKVVKK